MNGQFFKTPIETIIWFYIDFLVWYDFLLSLICSKLHYFLILKKAILE